MSRQSVQHEDPALAALARWPKDRPIMLLHSGRPHPRWATHSLLATPRAWFRYTQDRRSEWSAESGLTSPPLTHHLWTDLRALLNNPSFPGRWFGYFSYDLARLIEPSKLAQRSGDWPLVELAWCPETEERRVAECANRAPSIPHPALRTPYSNFPRPAYESAVRRALDYIAAGDIFQANIAQRFTMEYAGDPRALYRRLAAISPAWYGALLELPGHRAILSTSPELFLLAERGHIVTRPIKGTRPVRPGRFSDPDELRDSEKDRAELNMIVDLMRNDLGRVCAYRSVRVTEPRTIETHPTVHHGVATIEGDLHPSMDLIDLLKATLPGGSVTGAPKVRAMQIIDELETQPRGPYCGAIGYLSKDQMQLSVAIRTMLLTPHPQSQISNPRFTVDFSVGSGIVADSDPAAEYDETLTKAAALLAAFQSEDP